MKHSEAEDQAKQLEARKEVVRRILSKHSAEGAYADCLRDFLVDCIYLLGVGIVNESVQLAGQKWLAENTNV